MAIIELDDALVNLEENNAEDTIIVPANNAANSHIINSFEILNDKIDFTAYPGINVQEILANAFEDEDGTFVRLSGQFGSITLTGVSLARLTERSAEIFIIFDVAVDDEAGTSQGTSANIDVLANDVDPEGRAIELLDFPELTGVGGTITRNENGTPEDLTDDSLLYTPAADFTGTDSFEYSISVGGQTQSATVTVTVDPNTRPEAVEDSETTTQDNFVDIDVLVNDFDLDGDAIALTAFNQTTDNGGTITRNDNGTPRNRRDDSLIYTPAPGFLGTDSFRYRISDGLETDTATVTVTVNQPINPPPIAGDDFVSTRGNNPVNIFVLDNDFDPEGDAIFISGFTSTGSGGSISQSGDTLVYTPQFGFTGTDSFSYTIADSFGATASAIVTVQVDPNQSPIVTGPSVVETIEGNGVNVFVLAPENAFDPDGDVLSISGFEAFTIGGGTVSLIDNGTPFDPNDDFLVYQPQFGFVGTDSFSYTISDGFGGISTASVTVTVGPGNEPPVANDDFALTTEDIPVSVFVLDNDFDPDGDVLTISGFAGTTANGTVSQSGNTLVYQPTFGFVGTDSFSYTISDGQFADTATVTVQVDMPPNVPPVAADDLAFTTEGTAVSVFVLDNDFDPDGDVLTISGFAGTTANGTVSQSGNTLVYQPRFGFVGTDSFSYTISDGQFADTATVTVQVDMPPNVPPVAADDLAFTTEGTAVSVFVLDNDFDPDGDVLTISGFAGTTANGTVSQSGNTLVYQPTFGFVGTDSFSYTISDGQFADTATVTVQVDMPPNVPPVAADDLAFTTEGTAVSVFVLDNDFDPDGDVVSIVGFPQTTGLGGTVSESGNALIYNPGFDFTGADSFSYTISDGTFTSTAVVTVQVDEQPNVPPVAVDDLAFTTGGATINVFVLDNDSEPDGDPISIAGFAQTTAFGGTVSQEQNILIYTPDTGFVGTDSFSYTISDGEFTDTATVEVRVDLSRPIAVDDTATITATEASIFVLDNDFDPDGVVLAITDFSGTSEGGGTVSLDDNGTPEDTNDDFLVYAPDENFTGTDSFTYTITDIDSLTDSATVTVIVENRPPEAVDDEAETQVDVEVNIPILENDSDPDGDDVELFDAPNTSEEGGDINLDTNGTIRDLTDDSLIYTPPAGFIGTDEFTYTITDGELTDTATVTVTVPDEAPIAVDDEAETTEQDPVEIEVLANDSDPEGGRVDLTDFEASTEAGGTIVRINSGTPFDESDDLLEYTAGEGLTGTDSFTYTIVDTAGQTDTATVTVTVAPRPNEAPEAFDDFTETVENAQVTVDVLANDTDPDEEDTVLLGRFEATTEFGGTVTRDNNETPGEFSDDRLVYTPAPGFTGVDTFIYEASDGELTSVATVTVAVIDGNNAPIALDDFATTTENTPVDVFVLDNDQEPDEDFLSIVGDAFTTTNGASVSISTNALVYQPQPGFTGPDSFSYTISDGEFTDTATVTVTVNPPENAPPNAFDDSAITTENIPVNVFVLDNDSDPNIGTDTGDFIAINNFPASTGLGTVSLNGNALEYTPQFGFVGTDSFNYTIADSFGFTASAAVTVTVLDGNDAPIAEDDFASTTENIPVSVFVLNNDSDPDGDLIAINNFPASTGLGTVSLNGNALEYTPQFGFVGTDSFSYTIADSFGATASATVTVAVDDNELPIVTPVPNVSVISGNTVSILVLDNAFDPDGDTLSIASFTNNTFGGTVTLSDNNTPFDPSDDFLIYSSGGGFTGIDSITYTIADSLGATASATVTVTVGPGNQAPIALDDFANTTQDISTNIFVLDNDSDSNSDALSIVGVASPTASDGSVSIIGDALVYTPVGGFTGNDSFNYTISDGQLTASATVSVTVDPPPTIPEANPDDVIIREGESASIAVLLNDTPQGGGLQIIATSDASNGTTSISGNRVIYTPGAVFTGTDSFSYTIRDSFGQTSTAQVNVDVQPQSDSLTGSSGREFLIGINEAIATREVLDGVAGDDTLIGNRGADILIGGDGADVFAYLSLADSGADPDAPTELGDTIRDFDPAVDRILLDFEVAPGNQVSQDDVQINLIGISSGVASIGLNTANTPPEFLPEQFVIVLRNLDPTTTSEEIRSGLVFGEL